MILRVATLSIFLMVGVLGAAETSDAPKPDRPGWKLVWSDEFETEGAPDPKKWDYEVGWVRNGELQFYTEDRRENARVEKGALILEARKETFPNPKYDPAAKRKAKQNADYTASSLTTKNAASWKYGRVEVRAKLPAGRGTWPAIWMLPTDFKDGWPKCGEIDIMEFVGFDPDGVHTTIHCQAFNHIKNTQKGKRTAQAGVSNDFHVYAVEWTEKKIDFFLDEKNVFTFENNGSGNDAWPFDKPFYLKLNFAIGGGWGDAKGVDDSIFPQKFLVDYVRVYEKQ